jgi:hypothetical protein
MRIGKVSTETLGTGRQIIGQASDTNNVYVLESCQKPLTPRMARHGQVWGMLREPYQWARAIPHRLLQLHLRYHYKERSLALVFGLKIPHHVDAGLGAKMLLLPCPDNHKVQL